MKLSARNMPIWVACVARAHIDRAGGAVTVEKDRDVEAPRASGFALARCEASTGCPRIDRDD